MNKKKHTDLGPLLLHGEEELGRENDAEEVIERLVLFELGQPTLVKAE